MHTFRNLCTGLLLSHLGTCIPQEQSTTAQLPVVDLGYGLHQALFLNSSGNYYKFQNVKFAEPPVGDLRWRAPQSPKTNRTAIQKGEGVRICPQGLPTWQGKALPPIGEFTNGRPFTLAAWEQSIRNSSGIPGDVNDGASEDCLYLDVYVPRKVFNQAKGSTSFKGVPVLTWLYGGGYVFGDKDVEPYNLLKYAQEADNLGMIFVTIGYRSGAFGLLSGPEVKADGTENAAFYDQRLGFNWIQKYIHLFGGDPARVTAIGESSGGGSVESQLFVAGEKAPFSQAILQSPGVIPNGVLQSDATSDLFAALGVSSIQEARKVSSDKVIAAAAQQIQNAKGTNYLYAPVVDGHIIPDQPAKLLNEGKFDKSVKVLVSNNPFEGGFFWDVTVKNNADFRRWLPISLPGFTKKEINYLINTLYPPVYDGSYGYVDLPTRMGTLFSEAIFKCNALYLSKAYGPKSYAYEFAVSPGIHIQDIAYTFSSPDEPAYVPAAAEVMQKFLVSFVMTGVPVVKGLGADRPFPTYGAGQRRVNLTETTTNVVKSDINATRCEWWQVSRFQ